MVKKTLKNGANSQTKISKVSWEIIIKSKIIFSRKKLSKAGRVHNVQFQPLKKKKIQVDVNFKGKNRNFVGKDNVSFLYKCFA